MGEEILFIELQIFNVALVTEIVHHGNGIEGELEICFVEVYKEGRVIKLRILKR